MNSRTTARLLAGATALGGLLCTSLPAHAALTSPEADAFMVSSTGAVTVTPTPHSNFPGPPTGTQTVAGIAVAPFASDSTLTATTAGDPSAGTSSAEAKTESLSVDLGSGVTLALGAIDTTCTATPAGAHGTSSIANASLTVAGVTTAVNIPNNPSSVTLPLGLGSLNFFPSSTDANNVLTEDALTIDLLGRTQTLTIAQAKCGGAPASVTQPTPMISAPAAAGTGAAAVIGGAVMLRRRKKETGSSSLV